MKSGVIRLGAMAAILIAAACTEGPDDYTLGQRDGYAAGFGARCGSGSAGPKGEGSADYRRGYEDGYRVGWDECRQQM